MTFGQIMIIGLISAFLLAYCAVVILIRRADNRRLQAKKEAEDKDAGLAQKSDTMTSA